MQISGDSYKKTTGLGDNHFPNTVIFIPCCDSKHINNRYSDTPVGITQTELPNTWQLLNNGRMAMRNCIVNDSPKVPAINLYDGLFYRSISPTWDSLLNEINKGWLRIFVVSAGYGIIDIREPIKNYNAEMRKSTQLTCKCGATLWKQNHLENIICDLLIKLQPERVFGYFAGGPQWDTAEAKYRFFFEKGVRLAKHSGVKTKCSGCFFRSKWNDSRQILRALGKAFVDHYKANFSCSFAIQLQSNGHIYYEVTISFKPL